MNDFLKALPWQIASIAALIVGLVAYATGATDVWAGLIRVGIAFVVFFVMGAIARTLLSTAGRQEQVDQIQSHSSTDGQGAEQHPLAGEKRSSQHDTNL